MKNIVFRLKEDRKPVSWSLPIKTLLLPKKDENTGIEIDKKVHYMQGAPSIYVEDYKGQGEPQDIVFEDGEIEVRPSDALKLEILKRHPWFGIHYELVDDDATAISELKKIEDQEKALALVNESDDIKLKAIAMVILGQGAFYYSELKCKADLKKKAMESPSDVIAEFNKPNYEARFIVSLALLKNIIKVGVGNTSVVWTDNDQMIIRLAVGESAIDKLSEFLSIQSDEAMVTLQSLAEKAQGVEKTSTVSAPATDAVLAEKDNRIAELERQLAAKNTPAPVEEAKVETPAAPVVEEQITEEVKEVISSTANADNTSDSISESEKADTPVVAEKVDEATVNATATQDASKVEKPIEELREEYLALYTKAVPPVMKNNAEWISQKIVDFKQGQK